MDTEAIVAQVNNDLEIEASAILGSTFPNCTIDSLVSKRVIEFKVYLAEELPIVITMTLGKELPWSLDIQGKDTLSAGNLETLLELAKEYKLI